MEKKASKILNSIHNSMWKCGQITPSSNQNRYKPTFPINHLPIFNHKSTPPYGHVTTIQPHPPLWRTPTSTRSPPNTTCSRYNVSITPYEASIAPVGRGIPDAPHSTRPPILTKRCSHRPQRKAFVSPLRDRRGLKLNHYLPRCTLACGALIHFAYKVTLL